jgi:hypothetical protein
MTLHRREGMMPIRLALLILIVVAGLNRPAGASPFTEAAEQLDGEWRSSDFVLRVDSRRAQASIALNRPFEWQRFLIKEVRQNEIVFSVGAELFEAVVEAEILILTGTSFRGERVLFRDSSLRGTTAE